MHADGEVRGNLGSSHKFAAFGNEFELYGQARALPLVGGSFRVIRLILVQYTVPSARYIK